MTVSARSLSWEIPADRKASAVWLGVILLGMFAGFGIDFTGFLREKPPAAGIVYLHAAIFVGWLVLVTTQVTFVLRGRMSQHRRLGSKAGYIALLSIPMGLATGLTAAAQGHEPPQFIALHLVDLLGFITFIGLGVNIPSPKGEGFREPAQAGYESARGRPQSHTILKLHKNNYRQSRSIR